MLYPWSILVFFFWEYKHLIITPCFIHIFYKKICQVDKNCWKMLTQERISMEACRSITNIQAVVAVVPNSNTSASVSSYAAWHIKNMVVLWYSASNIVSQNENDLYTFPKRPLLYKYGFFKRISWGASWSYTPKTKNMLNNRFSKYNKSTYRLLKEVMK